MLTFPAKSVSIWTFLRAYVFALLFRPRFRGIGGLLTFPTKSVLVYASLRAAAFAPFLRPRCGNRGTVDLPRSARLHMGILVCYYLRFDISASVPMDGGSTDLPHIVSLVAYTLVRVCLPFAIS
jgi:hypothetical protein